MRTHTLAVLSLAFGLLAWFGLPVVGAVVAVVTGHVALNEIRRAPDAYEGRGMALTGIILGWLNLALSAMIVAAIFLFFGGMAFLISLVH
jgi:hypothetical protein